MEIFKIAGFSLVAIVLITLLKQYVPAYSVIALAGCTLLFLGMFLQYMQPLVQWLSLLAGYIDQEEFQCLLKAAGIALIAQNAQELCKDAGMNSLSTAVEIGGRCMVLVSAMPLFQKSIERFIALLQ